jgi:hypothetical protein
MIDISTQPTSRTKMSRLSLNVRNVFNESFNILGEYDLVCTDYDFDILKRLMSDTHKNVYNSLDKYIVVHYDTDYYLPNCNYGLTIFNLVKTFEELDIPLHTMIFVTNHNGIAREFKELIPKEEIEFNFPIIIDNYLTCFSVASSISSLALSVPLNIDSVTKNAMCLMGCKRIHRNIVFNSIKDNDLLNSIATAYSNT